METILWWIISIMGAVILFVTTLLYKVLLPSFVDMRNLVVEVKALVATLKERENGCLHKHSIIDRTLRSHSIEIQKHTTDIEILKTKIQIYDQDD